jgi:phage baseplate assembly protein gpV
VNERLLSDLVDRVQNRFYGKYRGTVTEVDTSKKGIRIKAKVPAVLGDKTTGWCLPCVPYAGKDAAIAYAPEEHAGVWIEFEGGDVSMPIWVGCYWHDEQGDIPSRIKKDVKVIQTPGGAQIVLDDADHAIEIVDKLGNKLRMDSDGITLSRGQCTLVVAPGKVTINGNAMEVTPT